MFCKWLQIIGENEIAATLLFKRAHTSIHNHGPGVVETCLVDGGRALDCAVNSLPGVKRRRCLAHSTRMGLTRGGGKRGGKGSLPRYRLDHGVPPKIMTKMISIVLLLHWLPSKIEYEQAMLLFVDEFSQYINEHVKRTYLDPKRPENLGGRAAGVKATTSSTNGLEKRGGNYKIKTKGLTAGMPSSEQNNFIYMMEGKPNRCAIAQLRT